MGKNKYIVELTETTKAFPKTSYYVCEYIGILHDTADQNEALVIEHYEFAKQVAEYTEVMYDFKARIIKL